MVLLDTNVISELSKERPDAAVAGWFLKQPPNELATTAITFAEVLFGAGVAATWQTAPAPHGAFRRDI